MRSLTAAIVAAAALAAAAAANADTAPSASPAPAPHSPPPPPPPRHDPMVAMICPDKQGDRLQRLFHNQYMTTQGKWATDFDHKATCRQDKVEVLEYCKKVYPDLDINNIVESNHYMKLGNWCKLGRKKCSGPSRWVKPFRCLAGPFQSDALLVPEHCLFDHIHNQTRCWDFDQWNRTARTSCGGRDMKLKAFAMLLPCGIDVFSGVEFVCCPTVNADKIKKHVKKARLSSVGGASSSGVTVGGEKPLLSSSWPNDLKMQEIQPDVTAKKGERADDDDYDDDYYDDDDDFDDDDDDDDYDEEEEDWLDDDYDDDDYYDDDEDFDKDRLGDLQVAVHFPQEEATTTTMTTTTTTTSPTTTSERPTADPYFTHYDPRDEHSSFVQAERRFEEHHRTKVAKVMKDWSDLEEKYQEMREKDRPAAEDFKKKMTERFQKTVQALEEESQAEKRQLQAMHQQRVISRINQKKKLSMTCFTNALNASPTNTHRVQKCLQKLLRSLHKDRHHSIQHYRHLLETSFEQAERERQITIDHLSDIDRLVNESLEMLSRFPDVNTKVLPLMEDYLIALRARDNTPASLLRMDREHERQMIDNYTTDIQQKIKERERERMEEKRERVAQRKRMLTVAPPTQPHAEAKATSTAPTPKPKKYAKLLTNPAAAATQKTTAGLDSSSQEKTIKIAVHATATHHHEPVAPIVAHAQVNAASHGQASYSVRRVDMTDNSSMYMTFGFVGLGLVVSVIVGAVVVRKRQNRRPHHQLISVQPTRGKMTREGFVEVDQSASPEEKHLAAMQMNGYENPTYKYFEASCT